MREEKKDPRRIAFDMTYSASFSASATGIVHRTRGLRALKIEFGPQNSSVLGTAYRLVNVDQVCPSVSSPPPIQKIAHLAIGLTQAEIGGRAAQIVEKVCRDKGDHPAGHPIERGALERSAYFESLAARITMLFSIIFWRILKRKSVQIDLETAI
jgi:hypothetical protein